ncbi:winged helix-turn-helix domain-containing protein [bacterium]|nr:winged helix-turn-helix domain-containing protein [bacterium]
MLESLLGNPTIEKVLFYLWRFEKSYAKEMADNFQLPVNAIQQQLKRLENGDIVVSRLVGRTRVYEFNPRYPFLKECFQLFSKVFSHFPVKQVERYYTKRTRPRRPGKPI